MHVVSEAQKMGGIAAFVDAEHALDPSWAKKLGVDLETLLVSQPGHGEEAMQKALETKTIRQLHQLQRELLEGKNRYE